jgi:hypothetical protein
MNELRYSNRELTLMFDGLHEKMDEMLLKQDYTNGRVRKLYTYLTIVASATVTLLFTNGSELLALIKLII